MLNASVTINPGNFRSLRRMFPITGDIVAGIAAFSSMISPSSSVSVGFDFTFCGKGRTAVGSICGKAMWPTITAPTPAFTAARNGTNSTEFSRSRPTLISGSPRCESTAVSPCPGKCFAVAIAPASWAPSVNAAAKRATSIGSSPYERTLITGFAALLFTSTTGAKICCTPSARASRAVISPCRRA